VSAGQDIPFPQKATLEEYLLHSYLLYNVPISFYRLSLCRHLRLNTLTIPASHISLENLKLTHETMAQNGNSHPSATTYPAADSPIGNIASLHNKVALITGGSSGLGRAIAQAYAAAGAYIVSADLQEEPPHAPVVEESLKDTGTDFRTPTVELVNRRWPASDSGDGAVKKRESRAVFVRTDVTDEESVKAAVKTAVDVYGRLDIMVNNAGMLKFFYPKIVTSSVTYSPSSPTGISAESVKRSNTTGSLARIHETDVAVLDASLAVNVRGVWLGTKHACAQFLSQEPWNATTGERGWIINLASIMASAGLVGATSYCASKGAVLQLTRAAALEYAPDKIHVNAIQPGFTDTHLLETLYATAPGGRDSVAKHLNTVHPWGRTGRPEDIARVAAFLAGEGVGWVTGTGIVVDGGYLAQ
jgi:NAD(P)-dependent dehydrogenase (short-subunit alcohol dehydrogenase family)